METSFVEWINQLMHAHPLLARVVVEFSTWGVPLFGILAVGRWPLSPTGDTIWKRACAAGLSAAALSIAFGVFFVSRRPGWLLLAFAAVVSASRVMAGMHYPTDVLGSLVVSAACGYFTARIAMRPVLVPLINACSRVTDPLLVRVSHLRPVRHTIMQPRFRGVAVGAVCAAVLVRILFAERAHLLDEMELTVVAAGIAIALVAVSVSPHRFWRMQSAG